MKITFTKHAKDRIKERKIELVWIEDALKSPDNESEEDGRFYAKKKINNHSIEVVYEKVCD
jgi:hypothetical protein